MEQYFYRDGKEKRGPFSLEEMTRQPLTEQTPVWHAGLGDWKPACALPQLAHNMLLLRPSRDNRKLMIAAAVSLLLLAVLFGFRKQLFGKNTGDQSPVSVSSQQLYDRLSPSVLLIQHKFMYVLQCGSTRVYFTGFNSYDEGVYLAGLTADSAAAAHASESIQGTGFFVSTDGKLLTNRHVALGDPSRSEQVAIGAALLERIRNSRDEGRQLDSLKLGRDSLLAAINAMANDSTASVRRAELNKELSDVEEAIGDWDDEPGSALAIDSATQTRLALGDYQVRKITLEMRVFTPGSDVVEGGGFACKTIATSDVEEVDLALVQLKGAALPDTSAHPIDLSRLRAILNDRKEAQISERLLLIGYNLGTDLANTSAGIKPQLTEGRISQNADAYKLMYTIPTLPGSSGSPVIDEKGRLVSVNFAGISSTQSFNYGIQPKQVAQFLKSEKILLPDR